MWGHGLGIGILKGLFERIAQYQSPHCGCNPQILLSDMLARILKRSAPPLFLFYSHSLGVVAFFMDELRRG